MNILANQIIHFLKKQNVSQSFGIIGGAIETFHNELVLSNINISYPSNENTSALAAGMYYEFNNNFAIVFSTTGPGILNMINGISCCFADKRPFFLILPQENNLIHDKGALQTSRYGGCNTINILREITCYCDEITHEEQLEQKINLAWDKMIENKQPVCLSIPSNLFNKKINDIQIFHSISKNTEELKNDILENKNECCFIIGKELININGILNFCIEHNISIFDTPMSRGILPNFNLYKGMIGLGGKEESILLFSQYKYIYFFEEDIQETNIGLSNELIDKVIMISSRYSNLYRGRNKRFLISDINDLFPDNKKPKLIIENDFNVNTDNEKITTPEVIHYIYSNLKNYYLFLDSGNSFIFGLHHMKILDNNLEKRIFIGMGQATMGCAIPYLIGAAQNKNNDSLFIAIIGDGAFNMMSNEFNLLKKLNARVLIIILNDSIMGMAYHGQKISGAKQRGFDNGFINYSLLSESCGFKSQIINNIKDFENINFNNINKLLLDIRINKEIQPPILGRMKNIISNQ